jgi:hypothetical protein
MSIAVQIHPKNFTVEQYDEVVRREEATGMFPPEGREHHVCFGQDGDLRVSQVWASVEHLQAYGEILMPILAEVGVQMSAEPEVFEVYSCTR